MFRRRERTVMSLLLLLLLAGFVVGVWRCCRGRGRKELVATEGRNQAWREER